MSAPARSTGALRLLHCVPLIVALLTVFGAAPHSLPGGPTPAAAHESRPGYLEFRETSPGVFRVLWKKPARGEMILSIDPVFPVEWSLSLIDVSR